MASIRVPCPKTPWVAAPVGSSEPQNSLDKQQRISFPLRVSSLNPSLSFGSTISGFEWTNKKQSAIRKLQAELKEVTANRSSNSAPVAHPKSEVASTEGKDASSRSNIPDAASISAFMTQASDLVKLVDSRDIVELQLKQLDFEIIIRKKEALEQPAPAAPVSMIAPPYAHAMLPTPPPPQAPIPPPPSPTQAAATPALPSPPKVNTSSHPALKCPMAGTFYWSPAPGEPPFVKVGDKVQKGQVLCIIEAMKLMNEIEADQSGTITEILVEDGKPVSVDMPLFVIVP